MSSSLADAIVIVVVVFLFIFFGIHSTHYLSIIYAAKRKTHIGIILFESERRRRRIRNKKVYI